jgi:hypothetical protein
MEVDAGESAAVLVLRGNGASRLAQPLLATHPIRSALGSDGAYAYRRAGRPSSHRVQRPRQSGVRNHDRRSSGRDLPSAMASRPTDYELCSGCIPERWPRRRLDRGTKVRRVSDEEHIASVGVIYSTGDPRDGLYDSPDWSGPGRELRQFWSWSCTCELDGSLHETRAAAEVEAREHTPLIAAGRQPQ